jgi:hypothetical protein
VTVTVAVIVIGNTPYVHECCFDAALQVDTFIHDFLKQEGGEKKMKESLQELLLVRAVVRCVACVFWSRSLWTSSLWKSSLWKSLLWKSSLSHRCCCWRPAIVAGV